MASLQPILLVEVQKLVDFDQFTNAVLNWVYMKRY